MDIVEELPKINKIFKKANYFPLYHSLDIEKYLQRMASRGMFLISFTDMNWYFQKDTPKKISYRIVFSEDCNPIYIADKPFDYFYANNQVEGWQLVACFKEMQIFANADKEPTPYPMSETEKLEKSKNFINKYTINSKLYHLIVFIAVLIMSVTTIRSQSTAFGNTVIFLCTISIIYNIFHIVNYIIWKKQSTTANKFLENTYNYALPSYVVTYMISLICMILSLAIVPREFFTTYIFILVANISIVVYGFKQFQNFLIETDFPKNARMAMCFMYLLFSVSIVTILAMF